MVKSKPHNYEVQIGGSNMDAYKPITDNWYVSKFNSVNEGLKPYTFPENIKLADCTLRDGEQQPGVV